MRVFLLVIGLLGMLLVLSPNAKATGYYGGYRYSAYYQPGYRYYYAGYYGSTYYPAGYYQNVYPTYNYYYPPQVNVTQYVPYLNTYYGIPYSTYQLPPAYPAVPLNAVAPVQAAPAHDCTAQTKALKERLDALEKKMVSPVAAPPTAPPSPPPVQQPPLQPQRQQSQAPPQQPLSGAQVFADRCLRCHNRGVADQVVDGKPKGGKITLDPMTSTLIVGSLRQLQQRKMPKDGPLNDSETDALVTYLLSLRTN